MLFCSYRRLQIFSFFLGNIHIYFIDYELIETSFWGTDFRNASQSLGRRIFPFIHWPKVISLLDNGRNLIFHWLTKFSVICFVIIIFSSALPLYRRILFIQDVTLVPRCSWNGTTVISTMPVHISAFICCFQLVPQQNMPDVLHFSHYLYDTTNVTSSSLFSSKDFSQCKSMLYV